MKAVIVAVDYLDCLRICLPYNRHHFSSVTVVTSPADAPNLEDMVCRWSANLLVTDAFYRNGARFNKALALEEGLTHAGRDGWVCSLDADVLWPKDAKFDLKPGNLYTPYRRMCPLVPLAPDDIPPEHNWANFPRHRNEGEHAGYTQVFHADDPVLGTPPWFDTSWSHGGGYDSFFQRKWPTGRKLRPDWECLHVGKAGENWCGRITAYADGTLPPDAAENRKAIHGVWDRRRVERDPHFKSERLM